MPQHADPYATHAPAGAPDPAPSRARTGLLSVLLIGAAVSVTLGVFGRVHTPKGVAVDVAGFSGPLEVKAWLATLAATTIASSLA